MPDEAAIEEFRSSLRGTLLLRADAGYDVARKVFNAMIDRYPEMILQCAGAGDVMAGVKFAREHDLLVSVKGGGHSIAGKAVCDDGLMIDLSPMTGVRVDPIERRVHAQPGCRLLDLDRETAAFGMATPVGIATDTGIAGLTLGGGIGWLNGKYGLACDNLVSADVVTAEGEFARASESENDDLFWALRGGSGNFGIVTSFEYRLHPVDQVWGGVVLHPFDNAKEVLRFFDEFSRGGPDELSTLAALMNTPEGDLVAGVAVCYCGPLDEGEKVLKPLREFGSPIADMIQPMPYVAVQAMLDDAMPVGRQHYWKSAFMHILSDEAIEALVEHVARKPSPFTFAALQWFHGAAARVPVAETAFPHRQEQYDFIILSQWDDPAEADENIRWTRGLWDAMQSSVEESVYVNDLGDEGEDRVRAAYGANFDRLAAIKAKWDPTNFFRMNQNIPPAGK